MADSPPAFAARKKGGNLYMFSDDDDDLFTPVARDPLPSSSLVPGGSSPAFGHSSPLIASWDQSGVPAGPETLDDDDDDVQYAAVDSAMATRLTSDHAVPVNPDSFRSRKPSLFAGMEIAPSVPHSSTLPRPAFPGERKRQAAEKAAIAAASSSPAIPPLPRIPSPAAPTAETQPVANLPPKSPEPVHLPANVKDYEAQEVAEMAKPRSMSAATPSQLLHEPVGTLQEAEEDEFEAEEYVEDDAPIISANVQTHDAVGNPDDELYDDEDDDFYDTDDSEIARLTGQPARRTVPGGKTAGNSTLQRVVSKKKKIESDDVKVAVKEMGGVQIAIPGGFDLDGGDLDIDDDDEDFDIFDPDEEEKSRARKARQDFLEFLNSGPPVPEPGKKPSDEFQRAPLAREAPLKKSHKGHTGEYTGPFKKVWEMRDTVAKRFATTPAGEKWVAVRGKVEEKTQIGERTSRASEGISRGVLKATGVIEDKTGVGKRWLQLEDALEQRSGGRFTRRLFRSLCGLMLLLLALTAILVMTLLPRSPRMRFVAVTSMLALNDKDAVPTQQLPRFSSSHSQLVMYLGIVIEAEVGGMTSITAKNATTEVKMKAVGGDTSMSVGTTSIKWPIAIPKRAGNITLPVVINLDIPPDLETASAKANSDKPSLLRDWLQSCDVLQGGDATGKNLEFTFSVDFVLTGGVKPKPELRDVPVEFACPWTRAELMDDKDIARLEDELSGKASKRRAEAKRKKKRSSSKDSADKSESKDSLESKDEEGNGKGSKNDSGNGASKDEDVNKMKEGD